MPGRTITALFGREPEARRAADAVRALGYGDGRAMLAPWSGSAGFVLVVSPDVEDEDKLVGVIDHYGPARLVCGVGAGRPVPAHPSAADRLRAAATALRHVHEGRPVAVGGRAAPARDPVDGRDPAGRGGEHRRSLPETGAEG